MLRLAVVDSVRGKHERLSLGSNVECSLLGTAAWHAFGELAGLGSYRCGADADSPA